MRECYFCKQNINEPDFKETKTIQKFLTGLGKIKPKSSTALCSFHQRKLSVAVKRARTLGLLSYTNKLE